MHRIVDAYVGTTPVDRIYLGDRLVWQRRYPFTVPFTIPFTLLGRPDAAQAARGGPGGVTSRLRPPGASRGRT